MDDKNHLYTTVRKNKLIDWLVFYGMSTQDRSICANLPGGITGSGVEDSQRGTYKNIHAYCNRE